MQFHIRPFDYDYAGVAPLLSTFWADSLTPERLKEYDLIKEL